MVLFKENQGRCVRMIHCSEETRNRLTWIPGDIGTNWDTPWTFKRNKLPVPIILLGMNGMLVYPGHESHFEEIFLVNDKAFMMKTIDMAGTRQHLQEEMDSLVQLIERGLK